MRDVETLTTDAVPVGEAARLATLPSLNALLAAADAAMDAVEPSRRLA